MKRVWADFDTKAGVIIPGVIFLAIALFFVILGLSATGSMLSSGILLDEIDHGPVWIVPALFFGIALFVLCIYVVYLDDFLGWNKLTFFHIKGND